MLFALVRALQLNEAETAHLFDLTRAATGPRRAPRTKPELRASPRVAQLIDAMSDVPAIAMTRPSDKALMALVGELATRSNEFRTWWGGHTVRTHSTGTKKIHHPVVGDMTLGYEALAITSTPGLVLLAYLAEPATPSADALNLLRSWTANEALAKDDTARSQDDIRTVRRLDQTAKRSAK